MKKINIIFILLVTLVFQSCLKDDKENFPISASARMEQRLAENLETLLAPANGWQMKYYPQSHQAFGGFNIFLQFNEKGEVTVMSERGGAAKTVKSLYSLSADNGPVLRFDTHNELFHYYAEPKNPDGIGPADSGMQGDYEFVIQEATPEQVVLKGKKTNNKIILLPLPDTDWTIEMGEILVLNNQIDGYCAYEYQVGSMTAQVFRDFRNLTFHYTEDGVEKDHSVGYLPTKDGFELYEPLTLGGVEVSTFTFHYDEENPYFDNAAAQATLKVVPAPLSYLLVNGQWYFSMKNMGFYGKKYWRDSYEKKIKPRGVRVESIFLGKEGNAFGVSYRANKVGYEPIPGMFTFSYQIVDDNTVRVNWNGGGSGTYIMYGILYGFNFVIHPVSNSPALIREFNIETDDPLKPSWLHLKEEGKPLNHFKLFKEEVQLPFVN